MIKVNRIGSKLGLAGLVGVLLSAGMVANQIVSGAAVTAANQRANDQELIANHSLEGNIGLRRMQLAVRDIQHSRNASEAQNGFDALNSAYAIVVKELDLAMNRMSQSENKERLQKIKSLAEESRANGSALLDAQLKGFATIKKQDEASAEWASSIKVQFDPSAFTSAANRLEIDKTLQEANSIFSAIRAASLHYNSTLAGGEQDAINHLAVRLNEGLIDAMTLSDDKDVQSAIEKLTVRARDFIMITGQIMLLGPARKELVEVKTMPVADQAIGLMRASVDTAEKLTADARSQAAAELDFTSRVSFIGAVLMVITLAGSTVFAFAGVARPLTRLNGALGKMAAGELNIKIPGAGRGDEIGDIAKTVSVIRDNAEQKARDEALAQAQQQTLAAEQRKQDMRKLADAFEGAVGEIVETVSSASTELEASAGTLSSNAERAQALTTKVVTVSEEASGNVQSVASATEELTSSVNEIGRQVQESARIANEAVEQARRTNARVGDLAQAANHIGKVVELIDTIAAQTNLLALNATIEAARAGAAGRGFAVVASEVKALAEQTSKATGEISQQISSIQGATQDSVSAIQEIGGTIEKLCAISSAIAAAVEQQGTATQEIARNVQQAAQGTMEVSSNISNVQRGATETGSASSQVLSAAQTLSGDSNRLKLEVGKFLASVRSA